MLEPGSLLEGRYRIDRLVGRGGFGSVYAAFHLALEVPVAIKILHVQKALEPERRAELAAGFLEEGRLLTRLRHPNIVAAIDLGLLPEDESGERAPYLVMEWAPGDTLEKLLEQRGRPFSLREAWAIFEPLCDAVAFAHGARIAHRDLKPANVMVARDATGRATPRVIDFGVAKMFADGEEGGSGATLTASPGSAFTPAYAAPEQITQARTGPWTDVHALGLTFIEIATGKPPYGSHESARLAVVDPERPSAARLGVDLGAFEAVMSKAVALRPSERFADAGEMLAVAREAAKTIDLTESVDWAPLAGSGRARIEQATTEAARTPPPIQATPNAGLTERTSVHAHEPPPVSKRRRAWIAAGAGVVLLALAATLGRFVPRGTGAVAPPPAPSATTTPIATPKLRWVKHPKIAGFDSVQRAAVSPDGARVYYRRDKDIVEAKIDGGDPHPIATARQREEVFAAHDRFVVAATADLIRTIDLASGAQADVYTRPVDAVALAPNGRMLAVAGEQRLTFVPLDGASSTQSSLAIKGVCAMAFDPASRLIALVDGNVEPELKIVDVETGAVPFSARRRFLTSAGLAFLTWLDGWLAAAVGMPSDDADLLLVPIDAAGRARDAPRLWEHPVAASLAIAGTHEASAVGGHSDVAVLELGDRATFVARGASGAGGRAGCDDWPGSWTRDGLLGTLKCGEDLFARRYEIAGSALVRAPIDQVEGARPMSSPSGILVWDATLSDRTRLRRAGRAEPILDVPVDRDLARTRGRGRWRVACGDTLCFVAKRDNEVTTVRRFDPADGKIGDVVLDARALEDWEPSPDGSKIAYLDARHALARIRDLRTGQETVLATDTPDVHVQSLAWDGDGFVVTATGAFPPLYQLARIDHAGRVHLLYASDDLWIGGLVLSPDRRFAAVHTRDFSAELWSLVAGD